MIVHCVVCGKAIERKKPSRKNFCSVEHRNLWMSENVDFAKLARGHKAAHLTDLNRQRAISPIAAKPTQRRRVPQRRHISADRWSTAK